MDWSWLNPYNAAKNTVSNPTALFTNPTSPITGLAFNGDWNNLLGKDNVTDFTNALGLTDTEAAERGLDTLTNKANTAAGTLEQNMQNVNTMYTDAMTGRGMGDTLDTYRTNMNNALGDYGQSLQNSSQMYNQQMAGTENAADSSNVQNFLNPMYSRAIQNATNQALGGAGSSLQSSAANQAVSNAVGNQVTSMWNDAFNQAMLDAQNKQNVYTKSASERENAYNNLFGNQSSTYGATMQSDLMPSLNWAQLQSDLAGTMYTKDMDLAQAAAQVAGQDQSWLSNLF